MSGTERIEKLEADLEAALDGYEEVQDELSEYRAALEDMRREIDELKTTIEAPAAWPTTCTGS